MDRRRVVALMSAALVPGGAFAAEPQRAGGVAFVQLPDVRLEIRDGGGAGEPVVMLHPGTGSAAIWDYQEPALRAAGFRMIAYSRRGFGRSERGPSERPGTAVDDLQAVADRLGLGRFHLVGSAAGGFVAPDYALSHPARLLSLTIANSLAGVVEPAWAHETELLIPKGFSDLPPDFRELAPSYRLENPEGRAGWLALQSRALSGPRLNQPPVNRIDYAALRRIATPALVITGDCDFYMPPARARALAARMANAEAAIIAGAGHSAYWETPEAFNRTLICFLRRHPDRSRSGRGSRRRAVADPT